MQIFGCKLHYVPMIYYRVFQYKHQECNYLYVKHICAHFLLWSECNIMCGGPGFYPFEIHVFSILHNVLSFKAMFLVV